MAYVAGCIWLVRHKLFATLVLSHFLNLSIEVGIGPVNPKFKKFLLLIPCTGLYTRPTLVGANEKLYIQGDNTLTGKAWNGRYKDICQMDRT
jgi:hypothetical protein